ncbi:MAG: hypothetical protein K2I77_05015, partial [Anaeroplasmataceae bacterium]|nr:hypothetical protein [Anaeroplasmataceae bacterium]
KILHHLGKTNEALKAIYALIPDFPKMSDDAVIAVCDTIIEITLDINRLDQTKKYMDVKKKYLKVSTEVLGLRDDILYELASKNFHKAMELLKEYLNDEISHDQTIWALEELAKIEYSIHDYDAYLKTIEHLERHYKETFNTKQLIEVLYSKLKISEERGNYIKVIRDGNSLLNDYEVENELALKIAVMLIQSYLKCKDYHKATIIESNFEEKMSLVSNETALEFAKICIELYTLKNSLFNVTHYQSLVEKYQQACKKALPKEKAKAKIIIPEVAEAQEEIEMEPVNPPSTLLEESYEPQKVLVSKQFMDLEQLFIILNQQSTMKFREVYRLAMIELAKIIPFEESYLLYYHQGYRGLHYKKERAYDKTIDMNALEDTINFLAISKNRICFLDDESKEGRVDIVSHEKIITPTYGIAIPLHMDKEYSYASIAYWSSKPFLGVELVYETLKLISQMMNKALIDDLNQQQLRSNNKKMFFIYENMTSGTKEMVDGQIHLSHQATEMLGIFEDITEQEFKNHIKAEDLPAYQALENELYQLMPSYKSIEYGFMKNKELLTIKETFFPYYENGNIILYSMLDDITHQIKLQDSLLAIAYT